LKRPHTQSWRPRRCGLPLGAIVASALFATAALGFQSEPVLDGGAIMGTVSYAGAPPTPAALEISKDRDVCGTRPALDQSLIVGKEGGVANAVVTIPSIVKGRALELPTVVFDQRGCEYIPHVAVFPAGSVIEVRNSDGILHNIHTESTLNPVIDMAQPGFKKTIRVTIAKPEAIKVTCDAHNWMQGWWYATPNPYYAVTDARGHYLISGVPAGTYSIQVWQEKLAVETRQVTVAAHATTTVNFVLAPRPDKDSNHD
jgi:hypothetical protein